MCRRFFLVFILVSVLIFSRSSLVSANTPICSDPALTVPEEECEALATLYDATYGYQWFNSSNWLNSPDVQSWHGVTVSSGHVTAIELNSNRLLWWLPAAIGDLAYLETLSLENNFLVSVHMNIWQATSLRDLNISWNNLISLPSSIEQLTQLELLHLEHNNLSSLPDIFANLQQLEILYAQYNDFTSLPSSIGALWVLDILDVSFNTLSVLPDEITQITSLTILDLEWNEITQLPDLLWNMESLGVLYAQDNLLSTLPESTVDLMNLYYLALHNNAFTVLPNVVTQLSELQYLRADNNTISELPSSFASMSKLVTIYLNNNQLSELPSDIEDISTLRFVYLQDNMIRWRLPDTYTQLTDLHRIYLFWNELDRDVDTDHEVLLSPVLETRKVNLEGAGKQVLFADQDDTTVPIIQAETIPTGWYASGVAMDISWEENSYAVDAQWSWMSLVVSGSTACDTLSLSTTDITQQVWTSTLTLAGTGVYNSCDIHLIDHAGNVSLPITLESIVLWSDLYSFCLLEDFSITAHIPREECEALASLYLATDGDNWTSSTNWFATTDVESWHGVSVFDVAGQKYVQGLYLHKSSGSDTDGFVASWNGNNLVGTLPSELWNLSKIEHMNLSKNTLGSFPEHIWTINSLKRLILVDSNMFGVLPGSMENMDMLEILNMQSNPLSGTLDVLKNMDMLQQLLASNTNISGELPVSLTINSQLQDIRLESTNISWEIPEELWNLESLEKLYLWNTNLHGQLPLSFVNLDAMEHISIEFSYFDRKADHTVIIDPSLDAWLLELQLVKLWSQKDDTAPSIASTAVLAEIATWTMQYTLDIQENSYAVTLWGNWMSATVTGSGSCSSLAVSEIMIASGTTSVDLTPVATGWYIDCVLQVIDHGGNTSNEIVLPSFVFGVWNETVCWKNDLTIPFDQCIALVDIYEALSGDTWLNITNWLESPDVSSWQWIQVNSGAVIAIDMWWAQANNVAWELPDVFLNLPNLEYIWFGDNALSGVLPPSLFTLEKLVHLDLSNNALEWVVSEQVWALIALEYLDLSNNLFSWMLPQNIWNLPVLEKLDLANNTFSWILPVSFSGAVSLLSLDLANNTLWWVLPEEWSTLVSLEELDISWNMLQGDIPWSWGYLLWLEKLFLQENELSWTLPETFANLLRLEILDLSSNTFVWTTPSSWTLISSLTTLFLDENNLDRDIDPTHEAYIASGSPIETWWNTLVSSQRDKQWDIVSPVLSSTTTIPSTITESFYYTLSFNENAYAVNSEGNGMQISFSWSTLCQDLVVDQQDIKTSSGSTVLTISPYIGGIYNCFLHITDHGGNIGEVYMWPFEFNTTCGNGIIDPWESCDEWKFCDDMTPCTADPTICPGQCRPRLVDTCNPSCEASRCWDGYIDGDGIDNIAWNYDDETCDERSYCDDGTDCTRDPSICWWGYGSCKARLINDCNEFCTAGSCGDGTLDVNGNDNILWTPDDEECDDGNPYNGDGCSTSCRAEYCGDGYVDPNGWDNISSTSDDEECDLWSSNGILGGVCSSTCEVPNSECVYCYEICDGGTGSHSMFLLMDISWSMNNNSRLQNAKLGASSFVNLVMSGATVNTWFETKIGIIAFSDTATTLINPTTDYSAVLDDISWLSAWWWTNFGDPIRDAVDYFETYDTSYDQHMILLSDGEPTVSSNGSFTPGEWALYQANNAKARWIQMYTIAVDQTDEWLTYMSYISSSTLVNRAWQWPTMNKPVSQSSTAWNSSTYAAINAADSLTQWNNFSLTDEEYQARWQIDLNDSILIDQIHVWNRTSNTSETSDVYVHVSDQAFGSQTLDEVLANPFVTSYPITGEVARPSSLQLNGLQGQYVRVQLSQENPETYPDREQFTSTDSWGTNNNYENYEDIVTSYCPTNPAHKLTLTFDSFHTERYYDFLKVHNWNSTSAAVVANLHGNIQPTPITSTSSDGCLTLAFDSDYSVTKPWWSATLDNGQWPEVFTSMDPGWVSDNYENNQSVTNTYCPVDSSDRLTLSFSSFYTERYYDFLRVYNGEDTNAPLVAELHGEYIPDQITSTHSDGCLTLKFDSDYSVTKPWWQAVLSTVVENTVNLWLSEVQIIGCSAADPDCTDVFHYQDFWWMAIEVLYGHIFGSIHCGCRPEQVCGICWDGLVEPIKWEICDEWSYCDDLTTDCTADSSICAAWWLGECRPRFIDGCTNTCEAYHCGDGELNQVGEVCDDGNNESWDGCSDICEIEACGDGYTDLDGADNIWGTADDESCDDGNTLDGDGCGASCIFETCGDGFTDLDWSDNDVLTIVDNEQCDTWRTCTSTWEDCTSNPAICPWECRVSYSWMCWIWCKVWVCGDAYVQSGSIVVGSDTIVLSEACDLGMFCEDNFTPCTNTPHFCWLLWIWWWTCAPRTIWNCTPECSINICGDGYVSPWEQCDDGNDIDGDGCTSSCIAETCGDGSIDPNGSDELWNTLDDEICDDGNNIDGDGCTACKLDSCGNGILDVWEECDTINSQQCALPYCRLTRCGDGTRQWPNGQFNWWNNWYESCDGSIWCLEDCTYPLWPAYCGDGIIQDTWNSQWLIEVCDDGLLNGQLGYCAIDCQEQPSCWNGIVSENEQCDDGNSIDGDWCSSLCELDIPLRAPLGLSWACAEWILPIINPGEILPLWWQLEAQSSIDSVWNNCLSMAPWTWIQWENLMCSFSVMHGSIYWWQDTGIDITANCLDSMHSDSQLLADAISDTLWDNLTYPILWSVIWDIRSEQIFQEQQWQFTLALDQVDMTYCAHVWSWVIEERSTSVLDTVCSLDVWVTPSYITQDGSIFQEIESTTLDIFTNMSWSALFTVWTALDEEVQNQRKSTYSGKEIEFITQDFINSYKDKATQELIGIWWVPIYKVPNERIYVYPWSSDITLDFFEIQELVEDVTIPFTLIVEQASLYIEDSFWSENSVMVGMIVVNGEIEFGTTSCDETQFIQGIWIAGEWFSSTSMKNNSLSSTQRCSWGNIIVQGMLIGAWIDDLSTSRRWVLQPWDSSQVYVNYTDDELLSNKARKLFDICYFPALLLWQNTTLQSTSWEYCDNTNVDDFIEQAKQVVTPFVQEWYEREQWVYCQEPVVCESSLPWFSCIYDDSPCEENVVFTCGVESYECLVIAEESWFELSDYAVIWCDVINESSWCDIIEKECNIDIATNNVTCIERCSEWIELTCPIPLSSWWHMSTEHMIVKWFSSPSTIVPSLDILRNAFVSFMDVESMLWTLGNWLVLSANDAAWFSNTSHKQTVIWEIQQRRKTISEGSSLYIEVAPELWTELPPWSDEMLEWVVYLEK